ALNSSSFADVARFGSEADQPRLPRPIAPPPGLASRVCALATPPLIGASDKATSAAIVSPLTYHPLATPRCRTVYYPPRATAIPTSALPKATIERPAAQGLIPL